MAPRVGRISKRVKDIAQRAKQRLEARRQARIKKLDEQIEQLKGELANAEASLHRLVHMKFLLTKKSALSAKEKSFLESGDKLMAIHARRVNELRLDISRLEKQRKKINKR
ncbi:MAG: hypothetical protein QW400_01060 [Candidatus Diapherotrites archaeon]